MSNPVQFGLKNLIWPDSICLFIYVRFFLRFSKVNCLLVLYNWNCYCFVIVLLVVGTHVKARGLYRDLKSINLFEAKWNEIGIWKLFFVVFTCFVFCGTTSSKLLFYFYLLWFGGITKQWSSFRLITKLLCGFTLLAGVRSLWTLWMWTK